MLDISSQTIFDQQFNISIGYPRSDLCNTCEMFKKRIDIAERENNVEIEIIKEDQFRHWDKSAFFMMK